MPLNCGRSTTALLALGLVLLAGCTSNIRRAEIVDVTMPESNGRPLEVDPKLRSRYDHAIDALEREDRERAREAFEALLVDAGYIPGVHLNLALLDFHSQEHLASRGHLDEALRLSPRNAIAHNLDGSLLRREGRYKEAQVAYAKALAIDPDYADAHFNMAILFDIYFQYWIDAKEHYRKYQRLVDDPDERVDSWIQDLEMRIRRAGG